MVQADWREAIYRGLVFPGLAERGWGRSGGREGGIMAPAKGH